MLIRTITSSNLIYHFGKLVPFSLEFLGDQPNHFAQFPSSIEVSSETTSFASHLFQISTGVLPVVIIYSYLLYVLI